MTYFFPPVFGLPALVAVVAIIAVDVGADAEDAAGTSLFFTAFLGRRF